MIKHLTNPAAISTLALFPDLVMSFIMLWWMFYHVSQFQTLYFCLVTFSLSFCFDSLLGAPVSLRLYCQPLWGPGVQPLNSILRSWILFPVPRASWCLWATSLARPLKTTCSRLPISSLLLFTGTPTLYLMLNLPGVDHLTRFFSRWDVGQVMFLSSLEQWLYTLGSAQF